MGQLAGRNRVDLPTNQTLETCDDCGNDSPHNVSIEIRAGKDGKGHSRAPYRIATCVECGSKTTTHAASL